MCKFRFGISICAALLVLTPLAQAQTDAQDQIQAGTRVRMEISDSGLAPADGIVFKVTGTHGHYDRAALVSSVVPLVLQAEVTDRNGRIKILASDFYVKTEGESGDREAAFLAEGPAPALKFRNITEDAIAPGGPVAQNAIAACNRLSASRGMDGEASVEMSLPVVWRLTTGRFHFNWKDYDLVGPSEEIVKNLDFYRDLEVSTREATVLASVACQSLAEIATSGAAKELQSAGSAATPARATGRGAPTSVAEVRSDLSATKTAAMDIAPQPRCDGGMVREISSGAAPSSYVCLCPGNTKRIEKGENAFACVRPRRRR